MVSLAVDGWTDHHGVECMAAVILDHSMGKPIVYAVDELRERATGAALSVWLTKVVTAVQANNTRVCHKKTVRHSIFFFVTGGLCGV